MKSSGVHVVRRNGWLLRAVVVVATVAALASGLHAPTGGPTARAATPVRPAPDRPGYWLVGTDGGVFSFGSAQFAGSTGGMALTRPVVGMAATPSGQGYWLVASDGGVFAFGDAPFLGSTGAIALNAPIVGMASTPSGRGYWLVASDGGIFAFGDAAFHGSTGGMRLDGPIVGMATTPGGGGYWLVGRDGGIFAFGGARFFGSTGGRRLNSPIVGVASTPSGNGYWLVAADGGVFTFGGAPFHGSAGGLRLVAPVVGVVPTLEGDGYWLAAADGGIFSYGRAPFLGSAAEHGARNIIGIDARTARPATSVAFYYPWYGTEAVDGRWVHWDHHGHQPPDDIAANFYPQRGAYSSNVSDVIEGHMADMAGAGITTVVVSWWGQGSFSDRVLPKLIDAAPRYGLRIALHMEPYADRTPALLGYDLNYALSRGIDEVWLYAIDGPPASAWRTVTDRYRGRVRFWGHGGLAANVRSNSNFLDYAAAAGFDGIYTYYALGHDPAQFASICARARLRGLLCSPSVSPGYDGRRGVPDPPVADREGGARYDRWWTGALAAGADVVSITSYNEWHEGTQIEQAVPKCITGFCYDDYEGDLGRSGPSAARAYLDATTVWTARARSGW